MGVIVLGRTVSQRSLRCWLNLGVRWHATVEAQFLQSLPKVIAWKAIKVSSEEKWKTDQEGLKHLRCRLWAMRFCSRRLCRADSSSCLGSMVQNRAVIDSSCLVEFPWDYTDKVIWTLRMYMYPGH